LRRDILAFKPAADHDVYLASQPARHLEEACIAQGLSSRCHGHAVGAGHAFIGKAVRNHLTGRELLYLPTVVSSVFSGIKDGIRTNAALARLQGKEKLRHTPSDGINGPQSGDADPILPHTS
jgi:hypothetical protein